MSLPILISAEELRQFIYCKRIIYFRRIYKLRQQQSYSMQKGTTYHKKKEVYDLGYKEVNQVIQNPYLINYNLGLQAVPDVVKLYEDSLSIVEFKRYIEGNPGLGHIMQCMVGGILAQMKYGLPFDKIEIMGLHGKCHRILVNEQLHTTLQDQVTELREMLNLERLFPPTSHKKKCDMCEFYVICNRV